MQSTTSPRTVAEDFYAALARGDLPNALEILGADVRWHEAPGMPYAAPDGAPYRGAGEVAEKVLARITADVDELRLEDLRVTELGRTAVVYGTYRGTGHRTGNKVEQPFVHIWLLGDAGSVSEFRQYTDTRLFREAAGLA